jgi:serine/threonine protein kinase/class 3 adenylate cyclase
LRRTARQITNLDRLLKARAEIDDALRRHKVSVTVLFSDVVGSTAYFERHGDTEGVAMLQRHGELARNPIEKLGGRVVKTIGDSVMAEFPEPLPAVRAALEIQRGLLSLYPSLPEHQRIQLRIGIHSGMAFRHKNDIYGDAVNLAARIAKRSGPAQILISRSVRDSVATEPDFPCNWLGKVAIEGREEKEDLYEVIWTDAAAYSELRRNATEAFARGELVSPGVALEDFIHPTPPPGSVPSQAPTTLHLAWPPALLERYEILAEVGAGGVGIVYKARDRETSEVIALKVLKPEVAADQSVIDRFKNELRLARKITHKNVCRIYDFNRIDGLCFISMEYIEGESLRQILNRFGGLNVGKAIQLAGQACTGLREAHAQGVIHRDLKPENILIDKDGQVKLMDFGIARAAGTRMTSTQAILGTPAYMAPEQAEGKPIDHRVDIYALGLLLYETLTGRPAFSGSTPVEVAVKQVREHPARLRELEPAVPVQVEEIVVKCLEKDPAKRFQSVDELDAALAAALSSPPKVAIAPPPATTATSAARRRTVVAGTLILAALLGAFWLGTKLRIPAAAPGRPESSRTDSPPSIPETPSPVSGPSGKVEEGAGDRVQRTFVLRKAAGFVRVAGVGLHLKKVDSKRKIYTITLRVGQDEIEMKDRSLFEPVRFYYGKGHQMVELVTTKIEENAIAGRINAPRSPQGQQSTPRKTP